MTTKSIAIVLSFFTVVTIVGCGSDSTSGGTGGAGGGSQAGTGGATGSPTCDATYTCKKAITGPGNDPSQLCAGTVAAAKFATLQTCLCAGPCTSKCSTSVCAQQMPSAECLTCITATTDGCGTQAGDCSLN